MNEIQRRTIMLMVEDIALTKSHADQQFLTKEHTDISRVADMDCFRRLELYLDDLVDGGRS